MFFFSLVFWCDVVPLIDACVWTLTSPHSEALLEGCWAFAKWKLAEGNGLLGVWFSLRLYCLALLPFNSCFLGMHTVWPAHLQLLPPCMLCLQPCLPCLPCHDRYHRCGTINWSKPTLPWVTLMRGLYRSNRKVIKSMTILMILISVTCISIYSLFTVKVIEPRLRVHEV